MTTSRPARPRVPRPDDHDLTDLLQKVVKRCDDPARLFELYYWSQEPELAEVMRQFIAMPDEARSALGAFFSMAKGHVESVTVAVSPAGEVTLSSPVVSELMGMTLTTTMPEKGPESLH